MVRRVLSLKGFVFSGIVACVSVAIYAEMQAFGITWGVFLRAMAFYGIPSIFLMVGYGVMQRRGVTEDLFFKMVLFSFIWAALSDFIYKQI